MNIPSSHGSYGFEICKVFFCLEELAFLYIYIYNLFQVIVFVYISKLEFPCLTKWTHVSLDLDVRTFMECFRLRRLLPYPPVSLDMFYHWTGTGALEDHPRTAIWVPQTRSLGDKDQKIVIIPTYPSVLGWSRQVGGDSQPVILSWDLTWVFESIVDRSVKFKVLLLLIKENVRFRTVSEQWTTWLFRVYRGLY